ncbi:MAG: aminotransferase class IV, partial [Acidimicrobiales bacterium]
MPEQVWLDGELVDAADAVVSVFDHGLTVGDGVFETMKATDGRPFAARRHLARLRRSIELLDLQVPYDDDELHAAVLAVLASTGLPSARVRITVTGGGAPLGSARGEGAATVFVAAGPLHDPGPTPAVCTSPWPRNERGALAGIKSTSYGENVRALALARARGATEAIFPTTTG